FAPAGIVERDLVVELASLRYRIRRCAVIEDSVFALGHNKFAESLHSHPEIGGALAQGVTWLQDGRSIQLLGLYESRLRKAAERSQAELERIQTARKQAHAKALDEAIRLSKVAVAEQVDYQGESDFEPSADYGQFVFSVDEVVRAS